MSKIAPAASAESPASSQKMGSHTLLRHTSSLTDTEKGIIVRGLAHPGEGFYIIRMKSYGRAQMFLLLTSYEQVCYYARR